MSLRIEKKVCSKCGVIKHRKCFNKDRHKKDGYCSACKNCNKKVWLDYYKRHKERITKKTATYYKKNEKKMASYRLTWARANKDRVNQKIREDKRRRGITRSPQRIWFNRLKSTLTCEKCGENHPACIVFHHMKGRKKDCVSRLVNTGHSKERIINEINKCIVLCGNCHSKIHWGRKK